MKKDKEEERILKWMAAWFGDSNHSEKKEMDLSQKEREKREKMKLKWMKKKGFVFEYNDVYYTQEDLDAGKCPLNGTLINQGLIHRYSCKYGGYNKDCLRCQKEHKKL